MPKPTDLDATYRIANRFASRLPGVLSETFEAFSGGATPTTLTFGFFCSDLDENQLGVNL
ncbi:MAG: hypothetical protein FJ387_09195 [Verrucomicrobia bacterium]|nr:hypothetical protein [Verrucomicrobiota bacterium]